MFHLRCTVLTTSQDYNSLRLQAEELLKEIWLLGADGLDRDRSSPSAQALLANGANLLFGRLVFRECASPSMRSALAS